MHYCTACGAELLVDARFCGNCGRSSTPTVSATAVNDTSQVGMPALDMPTAPLQLPGFVPLQHDEDKEEERRGIAFLFPGSGQPPVGTAPMVQSTPQISGVPSVQGTPPIGSSVAHTIGSMQGTTPSSVASHVVSLAQSGTQSTPSSFLSDPHSPISPPDVQPPGFLQPPPQQQHKHKNKHEHEHKHSHRTPSGKLHVPKSALGTVPKWLLIFITVIVVALGGTGALAAVLHVPILRVGGIFNTASSLNQTHTGTTVTHTKGKGGRIVTGAVPTPSPCAGSTTGITTGTNLFFSGPMPCSAMTAMSGNSCMISTTTSTGESYYSFLIQGTVDGTQYEVSLEVNVNVGSKGYSGPGTYAYNVGVAFHQVGKPLAAPWIWDGGSDASGTVTITINGGEHSGSVYAVMPSYHWSGKTVTMVGNWTCGSLTRNSSV